MDTLQIKKVVSNATKHVLLAMVLERINAQVASIREFSVAEYAHVTLNFTRKTKTVYASL
jgi:hypothetical protein